MNKKIFKGAILETVLLDLINDESTNGLHGYAIITAIKRKYAVRLGPSTLYPELKLLENHGLAKSFWDISEGRPRKKYQITRKGRDLLKEYSVELRVIIPTPTRYSRNLSAVAASSPI